MPAHSLLPCPSSADNMAEIKKSIVLNAPQKAVWKFITEPKNFARYVDGYGGGKTVSAHSTGLGARYQWRARLGPITLRADEKITAWRPPKYVGYQGTMAGVSFTSSMRVRTIRAAHSQLNVSINFRVPLSRGGRAAEIFLRPLISASINKSLRALQELCSIKPNRAPIKRR